MSGRAPSCGIDSWRWHTHRPSHPGDHHAPTQPARQHRQGDHYSASQPGIL